MKGIILCIIICLMGYYSNAQTIEIDKSFSSIQEKIILDFFDAMEFAGYSTSDTIYIGENKRNLKYNGYYISGFGCDINYIFIRKDINRGIFLKVLAHEYVHYLQHIRGDLNIYSDLVMTWKRKNLIEYITGVEYDEREWEKEAYHNQIFFIKIYHAYKKYLKRRTKIDYWMFGYNKS